MMNAFELMTARTLDAALGLLAGGAKNRPLVKAGGIDVMDRLKERLETPLQVLNIRPAADAALVRLGAVEKDKCFSIGALVTLADIAANAEIMRRMPALAQSAGEAATPQVRNVATLGGNLCQKPRCWYYRSHDFNCLKKGGSTCYSVEGENRLHAVFGAGACHIVHPSNTAVPLMAHGASVRIVRMAEGKRADRIVPLDDFYRVPANPQDDEHTLEPGELIAEVMAPDALSGPKSCFMSVREKQSFDWPLVACAANLNDKANPRVVLGAVAPIPWRLKKVEALIAGKDMNDALIEQARKLAMEGATPMKHNAYKVPLVGELVARTLQEAVSH